MQIKSLRLKRALRSVLLILLLSAVGMGKMNASYDFSAVCETGQTLYYNIIDAENHYVELTCPGTPDFNNCWYGFAKPSGDIIFPESVQHDGVSYTVTSVGDYAFYRCSDLTASLTIPNSVTTIGNYAFSHCSDFSGNLTIGSSVTTIGSFAFRFCNGFTSDLIIPNSVVTIGQCAFEGCSSLTSIEIPDSVISLGLVDGHEQNPFIECSGLEQIIVDPENPVYDSRNNCNAIIKTNTNALITGCKNTIIPNTVTIIDQWAFSYCSGLTEITIPNSVLYIVGAAFYGCTALTEITIPNSVFYIGEHAFYGCIGLTSIEIPNSVVYIEANPFGGCTSLEQIIVDSGNAVFDSREDCNAIITTNTNVLVTGCTNTVIPSSVTSIGNYAFSGFNNLTSIAFPNALISIGEGAFRDCSGLTGNLTIPTSVTAIGKEAFQGCYGFTGDLTIPNSVTTIGDWAFKGCSGFTGCLTFGNSVSTIGNCAFDNCSGFTGSLTIPNSVTEIGDYAFYGCSGFTGNLTIGNSIITIGESAFDGCNGFTGSLIIPSSVIAIGDYAFYGIGLTSIVSFAETPPTLGDYVFYNDDYDIFNSILMCVPCGFVEDYQATSGWNSFAIIMGLCSGEVEVTINPSEGGMVAGTGYYTGGDVCVLSATPNPGFVFRNWTENGIEISTDSNYSFFAHPTTIVANFVPDGNIIFADSMVKAICVSHWDTDGDGELSYLEATRVTSLSDCFTGNTEITSFEELQYFIGLTSISSYAFYNCSNLSGYLYIPNSVTTIGSCAFSGCSGLTGSLTIPNSVASIGYAAFSGCSGLTGSLTLPNSVTTIGYEVFSGCSGFTGSLNIGNSVTTIGNHAFSGCSGFTSVVCLAETPPSLMDYSFSSFNSDKPVYVPCGYEEEYSSLSWGGFNNFIGLCGGTVIVMADPEESGTVTGGGQIEANQLCTVTAIANAGYAFANWTFNGLVVSVEAEYTFYVAGDMTLVAHFVQDGNIVFADPNVKNICVANWDTNSDGELSYIEAASVTDLGQVFRGNTVITSFEELQYFIGLTSISSYAFYNCSNLSGYLYIPNSVTTIGDCAFSSCSSLTGSLTIPNSVASIGYAAFSGCSGFMGNLTFGNSVTTIGNWAFSDCSGLTGSLTIPNSVTTIYGTFYNCSGLTGSLTIPNSVALIGESTFSGCSGFDSIVVESGNTVYDSRENCNALIKTSTNELILGCKNTNIPNSVITVGDEAFSGCSGLTGSLTIPNSVTTIGYAAFSGCSGLTGSLTISNSVITIGDNAFSGCSGLTGSLTFGNSVSTIGAYAFSGCSGLTGSLTFGNSVSTIGAYAFLNCNGLTGELVIPNSVTTIGYAAFSGCSGFTGSLIFGNSVSIIGAYAFRSCRGFTGSLTIPNSVTEIGSYAFYNCRNLTEIMMLGTIPPFLGSDAWSITNSYPIYVPYESLNAYKTATNWSNYESRIFPMAYTTISGYGESESDWRFIASPLVEDTNPTTVDNMITETEYDLYRFDQSENDEWQNYKYPENTPNFFLANGQGYLYANAEDVNLIFKGEFNEDDTKEVGLAYDANAEFAGWNLVGNPFPVNAYANKSYYTMNEEGTAVEPNMVSSATAIPACTGVMVKAEAEDETVVFSTEAPEAATNQGFLRIAVAQANKRGTSTGSVTALDKAIVSFNAGDRLEKFVFNKENAVISIPQGGKELAIACSEKQGEIPLNFKATKNGEYTITIYPEAVKLDYLHLIDNLTGADVDLLAASPSTGSGAGYTFEAKTSDYASRFRLVFSSSEMDGPSTGSGTFAFINNGNIIINGEGTLQIVDVTGRILICKDALNASLTTEEMVPGVYVLRLINGNNVKTQKIVIE